MKRSPSQQGHFLNNWRSGALKSSITLGLCSLKRHTPKQNEEPFQKGLEKTPPRLLSCFYLENPREIAIESMCLKAEYPDHLPARRAPGCFLRPAGWPLLKLKTLDPTPGFLGWGGGWGRAWRHGFAAAEVDTSLAS